MQAAGHEELVFWRDRVTGLRAIIAIHDTTLGPGLGGTRMLPYRTEAEAIEDALRLSAAMTLKSAAAGLDVGGGKAVIIGDPARDKSEALFRAYGRFLESLGGPLLKVQQHDIGADRLPEAAFDLAHARLVLSHLPSREQALHTMITALKPGGWIVIEDFDWSSKAPDPADTTAAADFNKVQHAISHFMTERGVDGTYGRQLWGRLRAHGLVEVDAVGRVTMYQGGSPGAELFLAAVEQLRTALIQSRLVTEQEIESYRALLGNEDFAVQSNVMMTAWGRRPPA